LRQSRSGSLPIDRGLRSGIDNANHEKPGFTAGLFSFAADIPLIERGAWPQE
jgi:hypothetical protein